MSKITPEQIQAWLNLAEALGITGMMAVASFKRAIRLMHPGISSEDINLALGDLSARAKRLAEAARKDAGEIEMVDNDE